MDCFASRMGIFVALVGWLPGGHDGLRAAEPFGAVQCEGSYPGHLQGICTDDREAIFWSFTTMLVKTDREGRRVRQVPVANHHGDLCFHDGRLYVAVNLGEFNRPAGKADSWVYVYDASTLRELDRRRVAEAEHGAGGIAHRDGRFFVVGGLPPGVDENPIYEYDESLQFQRRHALASGYTLMGIQTIAYGDGHWWLGCYGEPRVLVKADDTFQVTGKWNFDCALGIVARPGGGFLIGQGSCRKKAECTGQVALAVDAKTAGLRLVKQGN